LSQIDHKTTSDFNEDSKIQAPTKTNISSKKTLIDIREPIEEHLSTFESFYKEALTTDVFVLDQIVRYLLRQKGKKLRPTIVFLSAQLFGQVNERSYIAATMVELLHAATLIHDDVVDEANKRRGFLSINRVWKNKASVLLGDFLLSRGLLISLENDEFKLLKVLSKAVKSMSEGELRQLKASKMLNLSEQKYYTIISEKTASLMAASCECGAISTTDDTAIHQQMHEIGINMGIAFQIRDDLFDYGVDDVGKPSYNDIKDRKITLPLIHVLDKSTYWEKIKIQRLLKKSKKSNQDISEIVNFVTDNGGIDYAEEKMYHFASKAKQGLNQLAEANEQNKTNFNELIDFIIERKK